MRSSDKRVLQVKILDAGRGEPCDVHCGEDWSSPEVIESARQRIRARFGEEVHLEYVDLSGQSNEAVIAEQMPVLTVDGKPRIYGHFDLRQLINVIETELEVSRDQ